MRATFSAVAVLSGLVLSACGAEPGKPVVKDTTVVKASTETKATKKVLKEVATGFDFPWGIAFLPEGGFLVSERDGYLSYVAAGEMKGRRLEGVPTALVDGQGGVFDIILDPNFTENRTVYLSYAKGSGDANSTAIFKAQLNEEMTAIEKGADIFVAPTKRATSFHFGGRMTFLGDGTLMMGLGDGFRYMKDAQSPMNSHGTIIRVNTDGSIPADNPYADGESGLPVVYSYGHRNVQGLAYDAASDTIYAHEHGPKGGDEINIVESGLNYGWPEITYGVNYDGTIITTKTEAPGMEQPILKWVPSIAPSGMVFYTGDQYPEWTGDLLVSALAGSKIQRVDLEKGRVKGEEALFEDFGERFRQIAQSPDGYLYVLVDGLEASIYRIEVAKN